MGKTERPNAIFFIDGSILLKSKLLPLDMWINDPEIRQLYSLHRLLQNKVYSDKVDENGQHIQLTGADRREALMKRLNLLINGNGKGTSTISNYLGPDKIEKVKEDANGNIFVLCDLLATEIAEKINEDPKRKRAKLEKLKRAILISSLVTSSSCDFLTSPLDFMDFDAFDIELDERADMLLECYEKTFSNDISRFAEKYGCEVKILTENDPIMAKVFKAFFPNIEIIVVPNQDYGGLRKNSKELYEMLRQKYDENLPLYVIDDSCANTQAALNGGCSIEFCDRNDVKDLYAYLCDVIEQTAENEGFEERGFLGKVKRYFDKCKRY